MSDLLDCERLLAVAVVRRALDDARSRHPTTRQQSRAWLTAPTSAPVLVVLRVSLKSRQDVVRSVTPLHWS
jgi:hypothetical protein